MIKLTIPLTEDDVRKLKIGDKVELTGTLCTARDIAHKYLVEEDAEEFNDKLNVIYHCGPVVKKEGEEWTIIAAGPTTSMREEPYEAKVIEKFGTKAIIGKGGMAKDTLEACKKFGCVYLHAVGGAAAVLANAIKKVKKVYKLEEFGTPEAIWELEVEDFPVIVTMDSDGNSLHDGVLNESKKRWLKLIEVEKHERK